jgi:histidinol-phosphatase
LSALESLLRFAIDAALQAGAITKRHYQTNLIVEQKADQSPVTVADREAERLIRNLIGERFPDHAIIGEEFGADARPASHRWYIDPIDGTKSFIHGVPFYGVLIGLEIAGGMSAGMAHFPALSDTISAARGLGCHWNGNPARVSDVASLSEACVLYSDTSLVDQRLGDRWRALQRSARLVRGWGDCYGHCLVATGRAEVMLDPRMNPWDCAALVPILLEAGGTFTDWKGTTTIHGGDAVSTNGLLFQHVMHALS